MESFSTERTLLRPLTQADASELFLTTGDAEVMKYWRGGPDKTLEQTEAGIAKINSHWNRHGFGDWGVELKKNGELIGFCGLHYIEDMAEVNIGYALKKEVWRKGLGYEVCRRVLDYGFGALDVNEIVAVIRPENTTSIRLAQKLGMVFTKEFVWKGGVRVAYVLTA
jgi:ribosomal-protein-alanine N-acetyltransferase